MNRSFVAFAALSIAAGAVLTPPPAQAQSYGGQPPLYPYAVQADQPYAIEVAPNTYVIQRPAASRAYPYVRHANGIRHHVSAKHSNASASGRPRIRNDRAAIEDLRHRHAAKSAAKLAVKSAAKHDVVETKTVVHEKPVVIETRRVVDDPPRVIERRHYVEDAPAAPAATRQKPVAAEARDTGKNIKRGDDKLRVIHAEAEVTILGPDRMSIRLFRKRAGGDAKASAE
ncbi:MAG TPA: hypothetical protein VHT93_22135 [Pseudolabrys sp.]|jgi:hypothetical protein|nr:hypothetical protein [Pseudolabrys sp.]